MTSNFSYTISCHPEGNNQLSYAGSEEILQVCTHSYYNSRMGFSDDDEDLFPSMSSHESVDRTRDAAKKKELMRKLEQQMGAGKATEAKKAGLLSKMGLKALKDKLAGNSASKERQKEEAQKKEEEGLASGTKTLMKEEQQQVMGAHDSQDADTMIERQESEKDVSDEETPMQPG